MRVLVIAIAVVAVIFGVAAILTATPTRAGGECALLGTQAGCSGPAAAALPRF